MTSVSGAQALSGVRLALHLAGKQLRVALVAPGAGNADPAASASDVRAYALNQPSRELLESVRCWPDDHHATPVLSMQVHGDSGGEVAFKASDTPFAALNWIVDVPALEARLAQAVRYQPLIEVPQNASSRRIDRSLRRPGQQFARRMGRGMERQTL
jgi:2-polyprenyl-6-methoxyphenol hydroxylase-like FAD-dependent oxidoreductase